MSFIHLAVTHVITRLKPLKTFEISPDLTISHSQSTIMSSSSTPARGLSLYANLLDPSAATTPGSVSRAPVVFKTGAADTHEDASAKKHQIDAGMALTEPSQSVLVMVLLTLFDLKSYITIPANEKTTTFSETEAKDILPETSSRQLQPK